MPSRSSAGVDVVAEAPGVPVDELARCGRPSAASTSRGDRPSADGDLQAHVGATLQPGDAHHVELVEVAGEDREELHPLEQRLPLVLGEREHALVERQPGQLAVAEPVRPAGRRRCRARRRDRRRGRVVLEPRIGAPMLHIMPRQSERGMAPSLAEHGGRVLRRGRRAPRRRGPRRCRRRGAARRRRRARAAIAACRAADPAPKRGSRSMPGPRGQQRRAGAGGVGDERGACSAAAVERGGEFLGAQRRQIADERGDAVVGPALARRARRRRAARR